MRAASWGIRILALGLVTAVLACGSGDGEPAEGEAMAAASLGAIDDAVLDKGYHSEAVLLALDGVDVRSYIPEPKRKRRRWKGANKAAEQRAVYANRRRIRGMLVFNRTVTLKDTWAKVQARG